ncbi:MAG TPA: zinc-binding alcohol dehydrogenase family protein [Gaiellaceae bacterium]|nr:zinc-binding alcohol dehydrogenase family protein [Gaiellaceae bacterium]
MRAALVTEIGRLPELGEAPEPARGAGEALVRVLAVPLNPIDVNVAAGRFYGGHPPLPFVAASEAVGRVVDGESLAAGTLVWAHGAGLGVARDGVLRELLAVPEDVLVAVPDGTDPALAGALGVAGVAGWLPVTYRARVREGETVLVLGATGTVGIVALQAARLLGAGRIVAAGRRPEALARARRLGADAVVSLAEDDLAGALQEACGGEGPDYVVDPLWGEPVAAAARAAARGARIVNIGQSAGAVAPLASADVRGKQLEILGYSNFGTPREVMDREYLRLLEHAAAGEVEVEIERFPLERLAEAWQRQADGAGAKIVVEVAGA